jgi:hypothetical protein
MAMILSALLRRGKGPRLDVGVAPLEAPERDWRPKPLEEIVGRTVGRKPSNGQVSPNSNGQSGTSRLPLPLQILRDHWPGMDRAGQIGDEVRAEIHGHNDLGDAMRHAEWNRRMQIELGTLTALLAGYGHELENLFGAESRGEPVPLGEILMDLHNNSEGRRAGRAHQPVDVNRLMRRPPTGWQDYWEQYP